VNTSQSFSAALNAFLAACFLGALPFALLGVAAAATSLAGAAFFSILAATGAASAASFSLLYFMSAKTSVFF
jgi:hypothetical protein